MKNQQNRSRIAYNIKADGYDESKEGQFTSRIHRLLLSMMKWEISQRILDVACGTGTLLYEMNSKKEIRGFGVDISEQMIENAKAKNPKMEFHVSSSEALPFSDNSMDLIVVCAAYHHFCDVKGFAKEAARVLKPDGVIYIADIYVPSLLRILINPFVPLLSKKGDVKIYSPKAITDNFSQYSFKDENFVKQGTLQVVVVKKV